MTWNHEKRNEYQQLKRTNSEIGTGKIKIEIPARNNMQVNNKATITITEHRSEHFDMALPIKKEITSMEKPIITTRQLKENIKKLKNKKAAGPDKLKPELLYKILIENIKIMNTVTICCNEIVNWRYSKELEKLKYCYDTQSK